MRHPVHALLTRSFFVTVPSQQAMEASPSFPWLFCLTYAQLNRQTDKFRKDVNPAVNSDPMAEQCDIMLVVRLLNCSRVR